MRISSDSKPPPLPYNLFRSNHLGQFFQVSQKTFPYQNNKTQNNGIYTPKKHTKIQTKQNKKSKSKQNKFPNKTTQNKTKLRLQANTIQNTHNNKNTKTSKKTLKQQVPNTKKNQATKPQAFSVFEFISLSFPSPRLGGCASPKPIACRAIFVACNPSICGRHVKLVVQRPRPR